MINYYLPTTAATNEPNKHFEIVLWPAPVAVPVADDGEHFESHPLAGAQLLDDLVLFDGEVVVVVGFVGGGKS